MSPAVSRQASLNVGFSYLYRDASNYKRHGAVVFRNPDAISVSEVASIVRLILGPSAPFPDMLQFKPEEVGLPTFFFDVPLSRTVDDIDFHEFFGVEETSAAPDDPLGRSIDQFLRELADAKTN